MPKHRPHWCPCGEPKCEAWTTKDVKVLYLKLMLGLRAMGYESAADYLLTRRESLLERKNDGV
jgi:hypothetical protein